MKANFHNKNFALCLAFILRFKAIRKWPITSLVHLTVIICHANKSLPKQKPRLSIRPPGVAGVVAGEGVGSLVQS